MSIWQQLPRPFFILAPMDDVTDTVFRRLIAETAAPDLFFTEFANADGLQSPGRKAVEKKLQFTSSEQPLIAQIWGKKPESYFQTARELAERGFAGIDLNMGCPVRAVVKNGCCSALIDDRVLAAELIAATKEGAGELPVSVKTRLGFKRVQTEDWCGWLLEQGIAALTVHGRIAVEQSKYPAQWDEIAKVVKLRDEMDRETPIIGNGDVTSRTYGEELVRQTGVDGIMIGRGIFRDPWVFAPTPVSPTPVERIDLLLRHLELWEETWGEMKPFEVMKKFFKIYISDWEGAAKIRAHLMELTTLDEVVVYLQSMRQQLI
ncbi:MAG: tRNA-dihydrouridine synthase [Candidatus Saccharimonadales bacterium]